MSVRAGLSALLVGVMAFAVFASSPIKTVSDSRWALPAAISLERHGDLNLDEYRPIIHREADYAVRQAKGHTYYFFPYGTSVLITPVVWLADVAGGRQMEATAQHRRVDQWDKTLGSLVAALAVAVLFLVAFEVLGSLVPALWAAAVFAFGTAAWSTASRALWMHGPDMLLLSIALLLALWSSRRPALAGVMALPLAFAFVVRPTSAAAVVCFGAWVVWQRRQQVPVFVGIGVVVGVLFLLANKAMFGMWLHPYYEPNQFGRSTTFLEALAGNLVSPARGLFVFSPVFLLVAWRRKRLNPLEWAAAGTVLLHLVLISRFQHWWGGYSYGPRLFSDVVPLLVFLLLPVLVDLRQDFWRRCAFVV
ncbi:MAG: hypothetical protein QOI20_1043, partial [Acidimicrobiaceae bacterium]|nr:hypothetical protein [Acidimicrobiaceae bacterium]